MAGDTDDDTDDGKHGGNVVTVLAVLFVAAVAIAVFLVVGWISALGDEDGSIDCIV
jgi:hypothetical protein